MDSLAQLAPPSTNDGLEAAHLLSEQHATAPVPEKVHLLLFGSPSYGGDGFQRFYDILLQGAELQPCREALENACHSVVLPEAALMLLDETSGT